MYMKDTHLTVVQISAYYPPHLGGLERVTQEISEQLARDGFNTLVLTSSIDAGGTKLVKKHNLTIKHLFSFEFAHTVIMPTLLFQLLTVKKPAVFHLHLSQVFVPEMVWIASLLRGIPYVVHFHLDVEPSGRLGFIFVWWKRWIQPIIIKSASHIVTLSPDQTMLIHTRYAKPLSQISCIGNGVSDTFLQAGDVKREFHTPTRLLFVGRLAVQKRPERLIEALSRMAIPATLTIVGDGEDREKLEQLVHDKNLRNVEFRGALFGEQLLQAYKDADVFVLPSDKEGMPLVALEAMATGLPIVGSDVLGITELIKDTGVLVENPSGESFAKAIDALHIFPGRLQELSVASFQRAKQFSWTALATSLEELYMTLPQII
jgi:glycosyltransferase involved in cell wall biosynthesis